MNCGRILDLREDIALLGEDVRSGLHPMRCGAGGLPRLSVSLVHSVRSDFLSVTDSVAR